MAYSLEKITTVIDCDSLTEYGLREKSNLTYKKNNFLHQIENIGTNSQDVDAELITINARISMAQNLIATLPDGKVKENQKVELAKLEVSRNSRIKEKDQFGTAALIEAQFEIAQIDLQLGECETFLAAIAARKAEL
jgi:hypothetical protein